MADAAKAQFEKFRQDLTKKLHEKNQLTTVLAKIEEKTGVDRLYQVLGVGGVVSLYLIFGHFAELVCNAVGFLYPAYVSVKAIESVDKSDDTQWLTYWVVFAVFNLVEFFSDFIVGWFPFYWLVKCVFMLYLYLPMTMGAQKLYIRFVRPFVLKHQKSIDARIGEAVDRATDSVRETMADQVRGGVGDHDKAM